MQMNGSRQLSAPREVVWQKLNDIEVLKRCIPGCQSLEEAGDNNLKAVVALKIGPMNARFNGDVTLSELDPPNSYRISGSGKGGPAGAATGGANVRLEPNEDGTLLTYDVDARISGKIAQLGSRLIDSTAASLTEKFFDNFAKEVEPEASAEPEREAATAAAGAPGKAGAASASLPWIIGGAVAAILIFGYIIMKS
jgi:uncharacterized protein